MSKPYFIRSRFIRSLKEKHMGTYGMVGNTNPFLFQFKRSRNHSERMGTIENG